MDDFIASLIAAGAFCACWTGFGLLTRLLIHLDWAPAGTVEGSFLQLVLAGLAGGLAWRRLVRPPHAEDGPRHA